MTRKKTKTPLHLQSRLPFGQARAAAQRGFSLALERKFLLLLGFLFFCLAGLYIYFVMSSVTYVAARQEIARDARVASAEVGTLEARLLADSEGITEAFARERGFVSTANKVFVEKAEAVSLASTKAQ